MNLIEVKLGSPISSDPFQFNYINLKIIRLH
jgi:hypothetical protein